MGSFRAVRGLAWVFGEFSRDRFYRLIGGFFQFGDPCTCTYGSFSKGDRSLGLGWGGWRNLSDLHMGYFMDT